MSERATGIGIVTAAAMAVALLVVAGDSGCGPSVGGSGSTRRLPQVVIEAREPAAEARRVGDPVNGARLYKIHCSSCHGYQGRGDGPASRVLYPPARDHTDSVAMNERTDSELYEVIQKGGLATQRSRLMPRWDDSLSPHQMWDLVAFMRGLHQGLEGLTGPAEARRLEEVILEESVVRDLTRRLGRPLDPVERRVRFLRVSSRAGGERAVAFGTMRLGEGGARVRFGVALSASGRIHRMRTFERVVLVDRGLPLRWAFDRFLESLSGKAARSVRGASVPDEVAPLVGGVAVATEELGLELEAARRQRHLDEERARETRTRLARDPGSVEEGGRIFLQACAACHGTLGQVFDAVATQGPRARNLADGERLRRLDDEQLLDLLRQGGEAMNVSPVMPAYAGAYSDDQLRAVVRWVRAQDRMSSASERREP